MDKEQALKWADANSGHEVVGRLRSRKVAKVLASTVRKYEDWIQKEGERNNVCTFSILGKVCSHCECSRPMEFLKQGADMFEKENE